jgi:uncharacterized protein
MSGGWSSILGRIGFLLLVAAGIWFYLRYFEWKNLYFPAASLESTPKDAGLEYEDVTFIAEDGDVLHGWWIPHPAARGTILHCHGNAGNIGDRVGLAADLHRLRVNVFLFDYRGYGQSRGLPTELGTYRDARAAFEVVRARYDDVERPPVIVHGQSLGGAVAIQLALEKPVRGLVVESVLPSTIEMGERLYPWLPIRLFCRFRYDSIAKIGGVRVPKLFAHSRDDEMIPYDLARRVFDNATEPKQFVELRGSHNEAGWNLSSEYWKALEKFVGEVL